MEYPPGQKGYQFCDLASGTFFTSTAVIFDENSLYKPLHNISSASTPLDAAEQIPKLRKLSTHLPLPCHSSCPCHLTAAGEIQAAQATATKIHLEDVREAAQQCTQHVEDSNDIIIPLADLEQNDMHIATSLSSETNELILSDMSLPLM